MKPQHLRTFLAVAEHRSIRAAARALFVSQPAVTRTMRELDSDLDIPLLRRSVTGIELTEAGAAFQARASLLLEEMRRTREELRFMKEGGYGHVSVAMTSTVGLTLLAGALERFGRQMPQARVSISEDASPAALRKLQNGTLDFAIANIGPDGLSAEFSTRPLFLMHMVAGARVGHPLAAATSIRQLQDQLWVVPSLGREFLSQLFVPRGLEVPPRIIECESFAIAAHLMARMDLLGFFSAALFEQELAPLGVSALPLRETFQAAEVGIVTLRDSRLTPMAHCLMECIQAQPLPAGMEAAGKRRGTRIARQSGSGQ